MSANELFDGRHGEHELDSTLPAGSFPFGLDKFHQLRKIKNERSFIYGDL